MRNPLFILILLFSAPLAAQTQEAAVRFGVGLAFEKDLSYPSPAFPVEYPSYGTIYLPLDLLGHVRIEPELAWYYMSTNQASYSDFKGGIGLFKIFSFEKYNILLGGRTGFLYHLEKLAYPFDDRSKSDYYYGISGGGEYYFTDHISLGGEAQLTGIIRGHFEEDEDNDAALKSIFYTRVLIVFRFYIF